MGSSQFKPNYGKHLRRKGGGYDPRIAKRFLEALDAIWKEYLKDKSQGYVPNQHDQSVVYRQYVRMIGAKKR